jgi:hypothetical protein
MVSKTQRGMISFWRALGKSKSWLIGWSIDETRSSALRANGEESNRSVVPGPYALLVGIDRR